MVTNQNRRIFPDSQKTSETMKPPADSYGSVIAIKTEDRTRS